MGQMITIPPRVRGGIVGESTDAEAYGVVSGEDRLVREIMLQEITTAHIDMPVVEASLLLRNPRFHVLIVCEGGEPSHALTEVDISKDKARGECPSKFDTLQEIIQNRTPVRCSGDAILADALPAMIKHHATHVPVLNAQGDLIGALSIMTAIGALPPAVAELWLSKMRDWSVLAPPSKEEF